MVTFDVRVVALNLFLILSLAFSTEVSKIFVLVRHITGGIFYICTCIQCFTFSSLSGIFLKEAGDSREG